MRYILLLSASENWKVFFFTLGVVIGTFQMTLAKKPTEFYKSRDYCDVNTLILALQIQPRYSALCRVYTLYGKHRLNTLGLNPKQIFHGDLCLWKCHRLDVSHFCEGSCALLRPSRMEFCAQNTEKWTAKPFSMCAFVHLEWPRHVDAVRLIGLKLMCREMPHAPRHLWDLQDNTATVKWHQLLLLLACTCLSFV